MKYDILIKRPKLTVFIFSIITLIISTQALSVVITSDIEVYMPDGEPTVEILKTIREEWPVDSVMIYVAAENVTKIEVLKEIDAIERALNPNDGTGNDGLSDSVVYTASIASFLRDTNAILRWGEDKIPDNQEYADILLRCIPEEIKYEFITLDNKNAIIVIQTTKDIDANELLEERVYPLLETTMETHMTATGTITMYKETVDWIMGRIYTVLLISVLLIVLVLLAFHKSMKAVIIATLPIVYAVGLTFGTIGLMPNMEFAPTVIAVIPLLGALGVAYSLHMINHFAEEVETHSPKNAVKRIITTTGKAVLLSAITTIVGFASLLSSTMPPIENMGLAFLIGVLYCFISTMVLVPPLLIISKYKKKGIKGWETLSKLTEYRKHIVLLLLVITLLSVAAIPNVSTRTSIWEMMPSKMSSSVSMSEFSQKFEGGQSGVFLVEAEEDGVLEPSLLHELDAMVKAINVGVENASAFSIADVIKKLNFPYGVIPQYKEDVETIVNERMGEKYKVMMLKFKRDESQTLVYVDMPMIPVDKTQRSIEGVNQIISQYRGEINGEITNLTGLGAITVAINTLLMSQQFRFMFLSFLLVFLCLLLVFRSFKYAGITFIPILLILIWEAGALVLFDIPLNVATIMVASIAIGAGIDFSVHITERVRDELKEKRGLEAIKTAIARKSPSLVEATLAVIGGGIPIFLMEYEMISQFILLVLLMLVFACVSSILALTVFYSWKNGKWLENL